jgi:dipeptidyl-peptidase-4
MLRVTTLLTGLVALVALDANAQGTRADYARAAALQDATARAVDGALGRPRFIGTGDRFWYRVRTGADATRVVVVDPERGTRELAFDPLPLARQLAELTSLAVDGEDLALERLEFDDDLRRARFTFGGARWSFERATRTLTRLPADRAAPGIDPRQAPFSRPGGDGVSLVFENPTAEAVTLIWVDPDGGRRSYGSLAAGGTRGQSTYVGHVWIVVDARGEDRVAFVVAEDIDRFVVPTDAVRESAVPDRSPASPPESATDPHVENGALLVRAEDGTTMRLDAGLGQRFRDDLYPSATGSHLVAMRAPIVEERRIPLIESSPSDQVQPKWRTIPYAKPGDPLEIGVPALFRRTARGLEEIPIQPADVFASPWAIDDVRWARDASRFTVRYVARGHSAHRLIAIDAESGVATTLLEDVSATFVDTTQKTFLHWIDDGDDGLLWMSERSGWNGLEHVDARTGARTSITPPGIVVKRVVHSDDGARRVWFIACGLHAAEDPYHEHLCAVGYDGSSFAQLTSGDATHDITFTPSRRFFVDVASRVDLPPVAELRRTVDGSRVVALERADWTRLLTTGWRPPERFVAKGRDGTTDIWGILIRPSQFDPARKYPVVEQIYAGPHDAHVPKEFAAFSGARRMAELGFIVAQIDGMGTNWRSKAFHDVCWRNLADAGLPDRIAWLRAAAATRPEMDLTRVGIYGGSAGGQNALAALLHHGDFYSVGVADCGCHDNRMDKVWWNEAWMGYPIGPWYAENSNVTHAAALTGKLLLIVGELDANVDPASTMQVVNALIAADKDFDLLVMPGVGHGAAESEYGSRRRADFLVRHLWGVEPRAPEAAAAR